MHILSAEQTRLTDAYTIEHEPIASIDLMERASGKFVEVFYRNHDPKDKIAVVCGTGNNGGDGLAISRILINKGYNVHPFVVRTKEGGSNDFISNLNRLEPLAKVTIIDNVKALPDFNQYKSVVDAMFGSGLSRTISGLFADVINSVNEADTDVIAVDIPSGLFVDRPVEPGSAIVKAKATISFQLPKLSFFMPENYEYVGDWTIVDIGLDKNFIEGQKTDFLLIEATDISKLVPQRKKFAHKGSFGHGQLIGGSYGKMGAMVMAAKAFLRSGAGLLTMTIPSSAINIMQTGVPEAMVLDQAGEKYIKDFNVLPAAGSLGIGPGLGVEKETALAFADFLRKNNKSLVLDADALNILSEHREMLSLLPPETIITPHLKEFDRLAGHSDNHWQRLEKARAFAREWQIITVLKGAHSAVIDQHGKVRFNPTGNPGMATAGSGDVLLGIITALRTQGLSAIDAATAGTYIHGYAGDLAAGHKSMTALLASDIINALSDVFLAFKR
jgi:ADP-dependent NAD(P)H-hydrate dehydratase / NAD(P)H-hydrate epimerase